MQRAYEIDTYGGRMSLSSGKIYTVVAGTLNVECVHQKACSQVGIAVCINNNNNPASYSAAAE